MPFPRRIASLTIPTGLRDAIAADIARRHPHEAGGYLACERKGDRLVATDHVAMENVASEPQRQFVATATGDAPPTPRVFYHSHPSPSTPSGSRSTLT